MDIDIIQEDNPHNVESFYIERIRCMKAVTVHPGEKGLYRPKDDIKTVVELQA